MKATILTFILLISAFLPIKAASTVDVCHFEGFVYYNAQFEDGAIVSILDEATGYVMQWVIANPDGSFSITVNTDEFIFVAESVLDNRRFVISNDDLNACGNNEVIINTRYFYFISTVYGR